MEGWWWNDSLLLNFTNNSNSSHPCPDSPWPLTCYSAPGAALVVLVGVFIILVIIGGNLLVIVAVLKDNKLRQMRQNWLIVSLAMADFLVGILVMPLTLTYEIIGVWVMGLVLCELWLALDVLFVTASILNLCAISIDRLLCLSYPLSYPKQRTKCRMAGIVCVVWGLSFLICFPPLAGWRPKRKPGQCFLSTEVGYVLYSSLGSFYLPVVVLAVVYAKIFIIIKRRSNQLIKEATQKQSVLLSTSSALNTFTTTCNKRPSASGSPPDMRSRKNSPANFSSNSSVQETEPFLKPDRERRGSLLYQDNHGFAQVSNNIEDAIIEEESVELVKWKRDGQSVDSALSSLRRSDSLNPDGSPADGCIDEGVEGALSPILSGASASASTSSPYAVADEDWISSDEETPYRTAFSSEYQSTDAFVECLEYPILERKDSNTSNHSCHAILRRIPSNPNTRRSLRVKRSPPRTANFSVNNPLLRKTGSYSLRIKRSPERYGQNGITKHKKETNENGKTLNDARPTNFAAEQLNNGQIRQRLTPLAHQNGGFSPLTECSEPSPQKPERKNPLFDLGSPLQAYRERKRNRAKSCPKVNYWQEKNSLLQKQKLMKQHTSFRYPPKANKNRNSTANCQDQRGSFLKPGHLERLRYFPKRVSIQRTGRMSISFFIDDSKLQSRKSSSMSVTIGEKTPQEMMESRRRLLKAKDRKATLSLGMVLGSFVGCWLPFFVLYVLSADGIIAPEVVFDVFFWLGYCNSALNPLIYACLNQEFRSAFRKVLGLNHRPRRK